MNWLEYRKEPVTLHSGGRSHWLVRADLMFADEELRTAVVQRWRQLLPGGGADIVAVPRGGLVWAEALHGNYAAFDVTVNELPVFELARLVKPRENRALILLDDVVTTGASMLLLPAATHRVAVVDRRLNYDIFGGEVLSWARMPLPLVEEERP